MAVYLADKAVKNNYNIKKIKEFDPLDEGSGDEKRATSPPK
jgi:hypothetical protein